MSHPVLHTTWGTTVVRGGGHGGEGGSDAAGVAVAIVHCSRLSSSMKVESEGMIGLREIFVVHAYIDVSRMMLKCTSKNGKRSTANICLQSCYPGAVIHTSIISDIIES